MNRIRRMQGVVVKSSEGEHGLPLVMWQRRAKNEAWAKSISDDHVEASRVCGRPSCNPCLLVNQFCLFAGVAQLAEQRICNPQVVGSTPFASSRNK